MSEKIREKDINDRSYWNGVHAANRRAIYKSAGYGDQDIKTKIHVGIANTYFEASPGTGHLRRLAESVKQGVWMSGGVPMEFGVPATCGNVAIGSEGLRYELAARDVVAMSVETVCRVQNFDALIILASCDNIIAGAYLAAIRMDIPVIVVTGGSMYPGEFRGQKVVQADMDIAALRGDSGTVSQFEDYVCPTFGACPSMGTANTMQILGEALNLVMPGTAVIPAVDSIKLRKTVEAGQAIVRLADMGIRPSEIITKEVLLNTIMLDLAIAGSTNAILHILAYSNELGLGITVDDFGRLAEEIKCLVGVIPSGDLTIVDLYHAGGVPAVMKRLESKLYREAPTLLGVTWGEYLSQVEAYDDSVVQTLEKPYDDLPGLRILKGNISPFGAVCRATGVPKEMLEFQGPARVFDDERSAYEAIIADLIQPGDVVVLRYEGCKGSPGMNELMLPTDGLIAKNLHSKVALITDGRFSGFNHGTIIGHVSPEAFEGGVIALIREGDLIHGNIPAGNLELLVTEEELQRRKALWVRPEPKVRKGILSIYGATCRPSHEGGAMQNWIE